MSYPSGSTLEKEKKKKSKIIFTEYPWINSIYFVTRTSLRHCSHAAKQYSTGSVLYCSKRLYSNATDPNTAGNEIDCELQSNAVLCYHLHLVTSDARHRYVRKAQRREDCPP